MKRRNLRFIFFSHFQKPNGQLLHQAQTEDGFPELFTKCSAVTDNFVFLPTELHPIDIYSNSDFMILENKTAIITGGTRGIGRAIVETFAREGANIVFTGTSSVSPELESALKSLGANYLFVRANASSFADAEKVCQTCMDTFGRIDILVNNAGITKDMLLMMMDEKDWDDVVSVNLKSVFNYTKVASTVMLRQRSGSIVNLSSIAGVVGNIGQCNYAATKAGIIGFTKSIAKEIGRRNIRCNAIAPGLIDTDMTRNMPEEARNAIASNIALRRIGKPEEIANTALFLASDLSSYINGQVIICDGGM